MCFIWILITFLVVFISGTQIISFVMSIFNFPEAIKMLSPQRKKTLFLGIAVHIIVIITWIILSATISIIARYWVAILITWIISLFVAISLAVKNKNSMYDDVNNLIEDILNKTSNETKTEAKDLSDKVAVAKQDEGEAKTEAKERSDKVDTGGIFIDQVYNGGVYVDRIDINGELIGEYIDGMDGYIDGYISNGKLDFETFISISTGLDCFYGRLGREEIAEIDNNAAQIGSEAVVIIILQYIYGKFALQDIQKAKQMAIYLIEKEDFSLAKMALGIAYYYENNIEAAAYWFFKGIKVCEVSIINLYADLAIELKEKLVRINKKTVKKSGLGFEVNNPICLWSIAEHIPYLYRLYGKSGEVVVVKNRIGSVYGEYDIVDKYEIIVLSENKIKGEVPAYSATTCYIYIATQFGVSSDAPEGFCFLDELSPCTKNLMAY